MKARRARSLGETWRLAQLAGARAGVTRLADISDLCGLGSPVFQAVRPAARSLTVSQGKGASPLAARVAALLEASELAAAEALPRPEEQMPLAALSAAAQRCWSGGREPLTIDLAPSLPRRWVEGRVLGSDEAMPMPWDLLSLDFTRAPLEYAANSDGLATGNSREEAIFAALCELLEYHCVAEFEALAPIQRRARQLRAASISDPVLARELRRVTAGGFTARLWSIGQEHGLPVIACELFGPEPALDAMTPTGGSACHPDPASAALGALREAVQGRATLVAGARDDIVPEHYTAGRGRARALVCATLAVSDGVLDWGEAPEPRWTTTREGLELVQAAIARIASRPVVIFDHPPPAAGLHTVHALAPGLKNRSRQRIAAPGSAASRSPVRRGRPAPGRALLFAGPSIAGLRVPDSIEVRPPAVCGDLARLLDDPPAVVGLVDGSFGIAPTVWHKEILDLLVHGVRVLGAASIGALRAAELEQMGMEGVGAIFAAYRAGTIERDDAVMLLQAPEELDFAPLTLALVDAEYALAAVRCEPGERRMMQRIARTMPYELRTWARCLEAYRLRTGRRFPRGSKALAGASTLKRQDAMLLVDRLVEAAHGPALNRRPSQLPMTGHYLRMLARIREDAAPAPRSRSPRAPARETAAYARSR